VSDDAIYNLALRVGSLLAENGFVVVSGGRGGVMEAVCRGAKMHNSLTLAFLPGFNFDEANDFVDLVIPTGLGYARNAINVLASEVVISISGGYGTLSEIGLALAYNRHVIILSGSGGVSDFAAKWFGDDKKVLVVDSPEKAVEAVKSLLNVDG